MAASLLFVASICFLPFFKGEPCWGPRYLTPLFALWWVFVPAALARVNLGLAKVVLGLGLVVQLLGLSVDPIRLFLQIPLNWNYYNDHPWLGFDGTISHLAQRPREIAEVVSPRDKPCVEFNPGPLATHAGCLSTAAPGVTSVVGLMASPLGPGALNGTAGMLPTLALQRPILTEQSLHRYHIYNAPRPWVFSQWYLTEGDRPVDLARTIALLAVLGAIGLMLALVGSRAQRPAPLTPDTVAKAAGLVREGALAPAGSVPAAVCSDPNSDLPFIQTSRGC
jgi:hypothetical protein